MKPSRVKIHNLSLSSSHSSNISVACILIGKSDVRLFSRSSSSSRSFGGGTSTSGLHNKNHAALVEPLNDSSSQRGVITFTVRDAQHSFINCVIWGSDAFVESYNLLFHIGDAVDVLRPSIAMRKNVEEYNPMSSSPYALAINEGRNEIVALPEADSVVEELGHILRLPIKATSTGLQLIDVCAGTSGGEFADLLVLVRAKNPIKMFRNKQNQDKVDRQLATVVIMDASYSGIKFNIWNQAYVNRSKFWIEKSTVLQLIDVRVAYSDYSKSVELSTHGRTLIIENPKCRETTALSKYGATVSANDLQTTDAPGGAIVDVSTIKTVMTIEQICDRLESETTDEEFTAVLYALIERFDLDGCAPYFSRRCMKCKRSITPTTESCQSEDCILMQYESGYSTTSKYVDSYDIAVDMSDHTGSLKRCRLGGAVAESMLGCSLDCFKTISIDRRGEIKWKWLLERCTVKMVIKRKTMATWPLITIVDCAVSEPSDVLANIKMY